MSEEGRQPFWPRTIRRLALPIVLFWVALAAVTNSLVPQLEVVAEAHNVGMSSPDAPSYQAAKRIGKVFQQYDTDSAAMIVIEGEEPLGSEAHRFYDTLVAKLERDTKHVQHIQNFWGDPLTAAGSQSNDGKAALAQVFLAGSQGETLANESVASVRDIVENTPAPPGGRAYVTGAAPLVADQFSVGSEGTNKVTAITFLVIAIMLFAVYRSVATTVLALLTVAIEMAAARGFVAFLGYHEVIGLSTYSTNLLTRWRSPREPTTRSSSSAATRRRARPAKIQKPHSTPCTAVPRTS